MGHPKSEYPRSENRGPFDFAQGRLWGTQREME